MTPSGGLFGLVTDGGASAPFPYFDDWSGSWVQNLTNIIVANGYSANDLVTQISINIDNTLTRPIPKPAPSALIAKKEFGGLSMTVHDHSGAGNLDPAGSLRPDRSWLAEPLASCDSAKSYRDERG